MKKSIALLLATLFVLTACGRSGPGSTGSGGPSEPSGTTGTAERVQTGEAGSTGREPGTSGPSTEGSAGTSDPGGSEEPSTSGGTSGVGPSLPEPPAFDQLYSPIQGSENLWALIPDGWEIPTDAALGLGGLWGDRLLLSYGLYLDDGLFDGEGEPYWEIEWHVLLIDLTRGSLIGDQEVPGDLYEAGFLSDGSVWLTCQTDAERHPDFFGYDVVCFSDFPKGEERLEGIDFDDFCGVASDGTVWVYDRDAGRLQGLTPFDDRPDGAYPAPGWNSARWLGQDKDGKTEFFAAYDKFGTPMTVRLDRDSKTLTELPRLRDATRGSDGFFYLNGSTAWSLIFTDEPGVVRTFPKLGEYNSVSAADGTVFAEQDYDDRTEKNSLTVYNAAAGTLLGRLDQPAGIDGISVIGMDAEGRVYLIGYAEDGVLILYWKYDAGQSRPIEGFSTLDLSGDSGENGRIADEIYQKYGIRVFWDALSLDGLVWDYTCECVADSPRIGQALTLLSGALAKYPAGIFSEMTADQFSGLELYLCGNFVPTDGTGISNAAAITSTRYGSVIIMAFNVQYLDEMEQNLAHELLHVMEHRLEAYCEEQNIPYAERWASLNPKGFAYYDSYHDENGNEISDTSDTAWDDSRRAWFVDPYSKSYATEDRARVFENLYMNNIYLFDSPHLLAKGQYLCELIRAAFPSVGALERASWEILD